MPPKLAKCNLKFTSGSRLGRVFREIEAVQFPQMGSGVEGHGNWNEGRGSLVK